jgi:hypothetical protein
MANYYRMDYPFAFNLNELGQSRTLSGLEPELSEKLKPGDYVLAARWNEASQTGEVRSVGLVMQCAPELNIDWRNVKFDLRPNPQGGQPNWRSRSHFKFPPKKVKDYHLKERCIRAF